MTRLILVVAATAMAVTALGFAQSSASAAPPAAVSIHIRPTVFGPDQFGTWSATGAIDAAGTYVRTDGNGTDSIPDCFCDPAHVGAFQETFVLAGSAGTITVRAEHRLIPDGERFGDTIGVWQIASGTGSYARLSGHGTDVFDKNTLTLVLTGVASKSG
jgi:hypothetical protein